MEYSDIFSVKSYTTTRGHPWKLYSNYCRNHLRKHFFVNVFWLRGTTQKSPIRHRNVHCDLKVTSNEFQFILISVLDTRTSCRVINYLYWYEPVMLSIVLCLH